MIEPNNVSIAVLQFAMYEFSEEIILFDILLSCIFIYYSILKHAECLQVA